jgi:hypothetical protein
VLTLFDSPGAIGTLPYGINNHGQIVEDYIDSSGLNCVRGTS